MQIDVPTHPACKSSQLGYSEDNAWANAKKVKPRLKWTKKMESSESTDNQDENKNNSQTKKLTQIKKQVLKKSKKIRTDAVLHKYKETKLLNARTPLVDKVLNEPNIESKNEPSLQKSNPNQKLTELKNLKIILSPIKISSQNSLSGHEQRSQLNLVESEKDKVTGNKSNSEAAGLVAKENDYSCFGSWLGLGRGLGQILCLGLVPGLGQSLCLGLVPCLGPGLGPGLGPSHGPSLGPDLGLD
ncbi:hypothetical protein TKK_0015455 [Trichogramma kaykai]